MLAIVGYWLVGFGLVMFAIANLINTFTDKKADFENCWGAIACGALLIMASPD